MNLKVLKTDFYKELAASLAGSSSEQRRIWAAAIVEKNMDIKGFSNLLSCDPKTATRFLWLLSDIGISHPAKLLAALPYLFEVCKQHHRVYLSSFASFWMYVGVPPENEGEAIDLLFQLLVSNETNVTNKSRALFVLFELTKKYPELKNELRAAILDQQDKYSADFKKRAVKILKTIEQH